MRGGEKLGLAPTSRPRQFVLDVFIHDGLKRAMLFQHSYSTFGVWVVSLCAAGGFCQPQFWRMDYGQKLRFIAEQRSRNGRSLRCQPFMARIVKANGRTCISKRVQVQVYAQEIISGVPHRHF